MSDKSVYEADLKPSPGTYSSTCDAYNKSNADACSTGSTKESNPSDGHPGVIVGKDSW